MLLVSDGDMVPETVALLGPWLKLGLLGLPTSRNASQALPAKG